MREEFAGVAELLYIYIKEAHPEDEWHLGSNEEQGVLFKQPTSFDERMEVARTFVAEMGVETTTLVDDITNVANSCYAAWPERLYVIGTDGRIAYKGGMGPFRFDPEEVAVFLRENYTG